MDVRSELLREHSRRQMLLVAEHVDCDSKRFAELMALFFFGEYRVAQRSAGVVSTVVERHPKLIAPYFSRIVELLEDNTAGAAVHRNILRLLRHAPIPRSFEGRLYDICLTKLDDPKAAIAVRAFAMEVAVRIANGEAQLLDEVGLIVRKHIGNSSAALKAKARNLLKITTENSEN